MTFKKKIRIPGVSFSLRRALGIDKLKRRIAKETGIPTTKSDQEKKIGRTIVKLIIKQK